MNERFGTGIRPELGKIDFSGIERGGIAQREQFQKGMADAAGFLKELGDQKKEAEGFEKLLGAVKKTVDPNSKAYEAFTTLESQMMQAPLATRAAIAKKGTQFLNFMGEGLDRDLMSQSIFMDQNYKDRVLAQGATEFAATLGQRKTESDRDFGLRERAQDVELPIRERAQTDAERRTENMAVDDEIRARIAKEQNELKKMELEALMGAPLPQTEAQKVFERKSAEAAQAWTSRGRAITEDNIRKLEEVANAIGKDFTTGPVKNLARTALWGALGGFYKDTKKAKKAVEAVDIQSLKETFGGQNITDSERQSLFGLTFDPSESTEVNKERILNKIKILRKMQAAEEQNARSILGGAAAPPSGNLEYQRDLLRRLEQESQGVLPPKNNVIPGAR